MNVIVWYAAIVLVGGGCSSSSKPTLSYEAKMKHATLALRAERFFEARRWAGEALKMKPREPEAELLMAHAIEREIAQEKLSQAGEIPEELTSEKKSLQMKTWLERARGFLEINQLKEAQWAAEQVFQLDPENLEASRLMDEIKERAQKQGQGEELFLDELYNQEITSRVQAYVQQAEERIQKKQWAAARFAVEKILLLDPQNPEGERLSAVLSEKEKTA